MLYFHITDLGRLVDSDFLITNIESLETRLFKDHKQANAMLLRVVTLFPEVSHNKKAA